MIGTHEIAAWWMDFYAAATVLLAAMLVAGRLARQPVHRMGIAWSGIVAMLALLVCCALPGWPRIALRVTPIAESLKSTHSISSISELPEAMRAAMPRSQPTLPANESVRQAPRGAVSSANAQAAEENSGIHADGAFGSIGVSFLIRSALLVGALVVAGWLIGGQIRAWRLCRTAAVAPDFAVVELREIVGAELRVPRLLVHESLPTAVATGVWRPTILLPAQLVVPIDPPVVGGQRQDDSALHALLAHEWAHLQRGDLWLLAMGRLLLVVLFANPLYWLLWRRIRADQELLADGAAAEYCGRHDYAETLVAWARLQRRSGSRLSWALGIWERPSLLSRRIAMLLDERIRLRMACSRGWRIATMSGTMMLVVCLSLFTLNPAPRAAAEPAATAEQPVVRVATRADAVTKVEATDATVTVRGTCRDEKHKPIADARVMLFRIDDSDKNVLRPAGRMKWVKTVFDDSGEKKQPPLTFQQDWGDPDGQRLLQETRTDEEGRFRFSELPADESWKSRRDTMWVVVQATGKATSFSDPALVNHADGKPFVEPLKVRLETAASLRGRITNKEGEPVAGAVVTPTEFNYLPKPVPGIVAAVTDADGRFEINDAAMFDVENLPPVVLPLGAIRQASVMLAIQHADYAPDAVEYTKVPATIDHVLQRPAALRGRVVFDDDGRSAEKCWVTWTHESGLSTSTETDEAGNYQLERMVPGNYTIEAKRKENDRLPAKEKLPLLAGENRLDLRLKMGGRIKGRFVVDPTPEISSFSTAMTVNAHLEGRDASDPSQIVQAFMEQDGSFSMPVEPGRQLLVVWHPQWQLVDAERWAKKGVEVAQGETVEVELRLAPRQGGWANLIAEARAAEAAAKGKPAPPPEPVASAVASEVDALGDDGRMLKAFMDWPDELLPKEAMSYEAILPMLEPLAAVEHETIDGEEQITSISFADSAEMFQDDRTGQLLWVEYSLLAHIDRFPHLKMLVLLGAPGDDSWLDPLRGNKTLNGLVFAYPKKLTPAGMKILATLPNLQTLCAMGFILNDDSLKEVREFPKLEALQFGGAVTDAGVAYLEGNEKLKALLIMGTGKPKLTDETLRYAATMPNLESLSMGSMLPSSQLGITDAGLKHLAAHKKLREVSIFGALITDAGLVHLRGLKSLKSVDFENTLVTPEGMTELKKALPEVTITIGPNPAIKSQ